MAIADLLGHDPALRGRFLLAVQGAIIDQFDESDWKEFGYRLCTLRLCCAAGTALLQKGNAG